MKRILLSTLLAASWLLSMAQWHWSPDTLGVGFEKCYFDQGRSYDGEVRSTVIRYVGDADTTSAVGALYIHGFNDYFFQIEMAQEFAAHGYSFYAVDLRRYGRSLLPGERRCDIRDMRKYFSDIDSALSVMHAYGVRKVALIGHSTGGLLAAYYCSYNQQADTLIRALVLNSPFLDWNLGKLEPFVGAISNLGKLFPNMNISQSPSTTYAESLMRDGGHGEWGFNKEWKSPHSPDVTAGWVRAINSAQRYLRHHKYSIPEPVLVMYSSKSISAPEWTPAADSADVVLDVAEIKKLGSTLGRNVTLYKVNGGIHDLILSAPDVRYPLYRRMFGWLDRAMNNTNPKVVL
ncbi:MAG: alpha/beta hydrolase [Muribaculaceae bacterium]|nr:alpha/beta hydrolase [Muribaculaceae bacterium]